MIRLFRSTENNFEHNEWTLNEIISCKPSEAINDDYITELQYPIDDTKGISSNLVVGGIVSVPTIDNRPDQLFRIIDKDTSSTTITVQMQAKLLADLKENRIRPITLTGLTRKQAIQTVLNAALDSHAYSVGNLDINTNTNVIVNIPEGSVLSAIIGTENSILSEYGGEFIINNNMIDIVDSRGSDNGVVIEYGKNLSSISEKINNVDLATVLIPKSGDHRLPEYYIESPLLNSYEKRYFKDVDMNLNIWDGTDTKKDEQITIAEAYALMRSTCNNMFAVDKVDQMTFNYTVDFVQLSQTEEYKNYAILETVNIGDTVTVRHKILNLDLQGRVNKITYSVDSIGLTTIDTVEIGFARKDITDIIKTAVRSIKFTKDEILLSVKDTANHITAAFTIADNTIKQSVVDLDNELSAELTVQATKIDAVVQNGDTEGSFELSESAFKVAFSGSSEGYSVIDANGITIYDGRFKIKKGSNTVFYVNVGGTCTADGGFVVEDSNTTTEIGANGISITNEDGYTGRLQVSDATQLYIPDDLEIGSGLEVSDFCQLRGMTRIYGSTHIDDNDGSGDLYVDQDLDVGDDLDVSGTKNCLQTTKSYGKRRINAYETAEYYFGDIGEGIVKDGECIVYIDDIFSECINTSISYQVFIQAYSGSITSIQRKENYFIVYGIDDTEFGWELKAKRIGYENNRLESKLDKESINTFQSENILLENNIIDITDSLLKNEITNLEDILLEEVI